MSILSDHNETQSNQAEFIIQMCNFLIQIRRVDTFSTKIQQKFDKLSNVINTNVNTARTLKNYDFVYVVHIYHLSSKNVDEC